MLFHLNSSTAGASLRHAPERALSAADIARADAKPILHRGDAFERIVARERFRADRIGDQLSLIVMRRAESRLWPQEENLEDLCRRLRCTDELGWIDDDRLGLLLPHTSQAHAQTLAEDLQRRLTNAAAFEVSSYPDSSRATAQPEPAPVATLLSPQFVLHLPWWKRVMDIVGATVALILFAPIFVLTAIAVKATSPGPIFFAQTRAGLGGKPFAMYKFRSMIADAEELKERLRRHNELSGPVFKIEDDPRLTFVGRWIRKLSLDELPQLVNVLRGDMSLVGPRPPTLVEVVKFDRWQRRRLEVTPGITCIWQVSGRCEIDFGTWVRMDIEYGERRSFWFDVWILLRTIPAVIGMRGAY